MSVDERLQIVRDFNVKAKRLDQLSFTKYVREKNVRFSVSAAQGKEISFSSEGPEQEATEAFALTLRMFLQPNELLSLDRFVGVFSKLPVSTGLVDELKRVNGLIREFLDRPCQIQIAGPQILNRDVLDVFLYGGLAHTTRIREFERWQANPIVFGLLQTTFYSVVVELLRYIFWVHDNNEKAVAELIAEGANLASE